MRLQKLPQQSCKLGMRASWRSVPGESPGFLAANNGEHPSKLVLKYRRTKKGIPQLAFTMVVAHIPGHRKRAKPNLHHCWGNLRNHVQ